MFEFIKKKKLDKPKNNGNNESGEEIEAPDADNAIDAIDAALKAADAENQKVKEREAFEKLRSELRKKQSGGGCSCW